MHDVNFTIQHFVTIMIIIIIDTLPVDKRLFPNPSNLFYRVHLSRSLIYEPHKGAET